MVFCVCGLIGAGKTTFAKQQAGIISDYDEIGSKEEQLKFTLKNAKNGENVYHTTCFPTEKELEAFKNIQTEYIWINTTKRKALENIRNRERKRDIENIKQANEKNSEIIQKYLASSINFVVIDVFESGERW